MCIIRQDIVALRLERGSTKLYNILWETDNLVFVKMLKLIARYVFSITSYRTTNSIKNEGLVRFDGQRVEIGNLLLLEEMIE